VSLRVRLVAGVVALTALGLATAGTATYVALRAHLISRADQQLDLLAGPVLTGLRTVPFEGLVVGDRVEEAAARVAYPPGSYGELRRPDGSLRVGAAIQDVDGAALLPELPKDLPGSGGATAVGSVEHLSVPTKNRPHAMRVRAEALPNGGTLVVAVPLDDEEATLERLVRVELAVSAVVLLGVALGGLAHVQRSLRPLRDVTDTAEAIAEGDRTQRVAEHRAGTEVARMERALNTMLDELDRTFGELRASEDRLRRFVADASHELRTPLTSIRGYAELFRMGATDDPDALATAMRRIEEESQRMAAMVDDLLLLARFDEGPQLQLSSVRLDVLVADAIADARAAQPLRALDLDVASAPEALVVDGDEARLRQVLANLLTNALVHTQPDVPVRVVLRRAGAHVEVDVIDRGPGMAPEQAARVFERFNRGEPGRVRQLGAGTGLGLAIVEAIVHAHAGDVTLDTAVGEGCTFRVRLPAQGARNADELE
jgi:two-component system OmpR family sensor kinase